MRIAYCFSSIFNNRGMERILLNKANYLAEKLNYDVTIITTDQSNRSPYFKLSSKIKLIDLNINYKKYDNSSRIQRYFKFKGLKKIHYERIKKVLLDKKFDIVISLMTHDVDFLYKIHDGSKKILEFHFSKESEIIDTTNIFFKVVLKTRQLFLKRIIKKYDKFIVLTNEDRMAWGNMNNIIVIPNFISFSDKDNNKLSSLDNNRVIAVGSLVYQKGFDLLLEAWKNINIKYSDYKLVIFGGGNSSALENIINNNNMNRSVTIMPPTSNIREEYLNSSLFVLSSRHEGFGLVIIEAMYCGLPVIAYQCPCGPKDIIKDDFGYLVSRDNIVELSKTIESYIKKSRDEKRKLGQNAYRESLRYRIDNIMPMWDELFKKLVSNN